VRHPRESSLSLSRVPRTCHCRLRHRRRRYRPRIRSAMVAAHLQRVRHPRERMDRSHRVGSRRSHSSRPGSHYSRSMDMVRSLRLQEPVRVRWDTVHSLLLPIKVDTARSLRLPELVRVSRHRSRDRRSRRTRWMGSRRRSQAGSRWRMQVQVDTQGLRVRRRPVDIRGRTARRRDTVMSCSNFQASLGRWV